MSLFHFSLEAFSLRSLLTITLGPDIPGMVTTSSAGREMPCSTHLTRGALVMLAPA